MIPGSANPLLLKSAAAAGGYQVSRSLRFNSSDSGFCSRTPAVAGNLKTWTWSGWVKRSALGSTQRIFGDFDSGGANGADIEFTSSDQIRILDYTSSTQWELITTSVYRDPSAWYHILVALDTTQGTSSDRLKLYVNGTQVTTFGTSTYPGSSVDGRINLAQAHGIGRAGAYNADYFNGYLADIHFIDGQALTPSSFTEVSATTGQLIPKAYTGSFGTNGFWLKFSDNSAATAAALGKDYSGNNNDWTPNNLSVTAGAGNDSLLDTPTSYGTDTGVGGEVRGNYCTLNPLAALSFATLSNGNLDVALNGSASYAIGVRGTIAIPTSDKWYWEVTVTSVGELGIGVIDFQSGIRSYYYRYDDGGWQNIYINDVQTAAVVGYTNNDVIGIGYDADNSQIRWYKNGTQVGTNYSLTNNGRFVPHINHGSFSGSAAAVTNFGQRAFAYTAPSGFKALCDTNLPAPLTAKPNTVMDVLLYTGNGSTQTISGLAFSPDWVWIKSRSAATGHKWIDSVRGATFALAPTGTLTTNVNGLTAFTSDGFLLGTDTNYNNTSATYAAWCWDTGGTTTTETSPGTVSVDRRANVSAGFSIAKFTSAASGNFSIAHGLGVAPSFVLISAATTYHASVCTTINNYFNFGTTQALNTYSTIWGAALPTSSVVSMTVGGAVSANQACVAYCFAPVAGYSNGFNYTGNGSADGSFVYLGFRPRLIMLKRSDSTSNWTLLDTSREGYNVDNDPLYPNLTAAEGTTDLLDITSNGFKLRSTDASVNASAGTYIGFAWAENPFQYARAR